MKGEFFGLVFVQVYYQKIEFAPIGLKNMYNSGGAVESVSRSGDSSNRSILIKGRGGGSFGAYSSTKPKSITVNSKDEEFSFREEDGLLIVTIPSRTGAWDVDIFY